MTREDVDARLERLARETAGIRARPGFSDRVMLGVASRARAGFPLAAAQHARRALPVAVLVALTVLGVALSTQHSADMSLAGDNTAHGADW